METQIVWFNNKQNNQIDDGLVWLGTRKKEKENPTKMWDKWKWRGVDDEDGKRKNQFSQNILSLGWKKIKRKKNSHNNQSKYHLNHYHEHDTK